MWTEYCFHGNSAGSSCNVGDPGLIPGSGRSSGEEVGYPLQYSWASLVAHTVKCGLNIDSLFEIFYYFLLVLSFNLMANLIIKKFLVLFN